MKRAATVQQGAFYFPVPPPPRPVVTDAASWQLVILGAPVTKKNSMQMALNKKTGRSFPVQSDANKRWAKLADEQLRAQWGNEYALSVPVEVTARVFRERAVGDLNNFLAAIADALQKATVIIDDKLIESWDGSRLYKDAAHPRVELVVRRLG